jgi:hypothetical protein
MTSIARFAGNPCERCTQVFQALYSKVQDSIQRITDKLSTGLSTGCGKLRHAVLTSTFTNVLDRAGMLSCKSPSRAHRKPLRRIACGVAIALVGALCLPSEASSGDLNAIEPKTYIKLVLPSYQAKCLITLYGKESAFNPLAIGNLNGSLHTYGIPQLKNPIIYDKSPMQQVQYGIKYIRHRYDGDMCKALHHWKVWGWH